MAEASSTRKSRKGDDIRDKKSRSSKHHSAPEVPLDQLPREKEADGKTKKDKEKDKKEKKEGRGRRELSLSPPARAASEPAVAASVVAASVVAASVVADGRWPTRGSADELLDSLLGAPALEARFVADFVIVYRYFLTARELLLRLITRYKSAPAVGRYAPEQVQGDWKARTGDAQVRVLEVLEAWVRGQFADFEDDDVLFRSLLAFLDGQLAAAPELANRLRLAVQEQSDQPLLAVLGPQCSLPVVCAAMRKPAAGLIEERAAGSDGQLVAAMVGADMVDWLVRHAGAACASRAEAHALCGRLLRADLLRSVSAPKDRDFHPDSTLYELSHPTEDEAADIPAPLCEPGPPAAMATFLAFEPLEVARQLTLVAHELFRQIRPSDLKPQRWGLPSHTHNQGSAEGGGPGAAAGTGGDPQGPVVMLQAVFEKTTWWVASEVVLTRGLADRAQMLGRFVQLAAHLRQLRNYHGCLAVVAGLSLKPVDRLRATWRSLPPRTTAQFEALCELSEPTNGYAAYRAELAAAALPAFPLLSLIVQDVASVEHAAADFYDDARTEVNFKKLRSFAGVYASQVQRYQQRGFHFEPVPAVQEYLARAVVVVRPDDLYKISLQCEPSAGGGGGIPASSSSSSVAPSASPPRAPA